MASTFIATTERGSFNAMRFQGILVTDSYAQLVSMLEKNLPRDRVLFFAEPVHESSGAATDWYTDAEGPLVPFNALPPEERERAGAGIAAIAADIRALAEQMQSSADPAKNIRGGILALALSYPGPEHLYVAGNQPVLTCWGLGPGTRGAQPEDLMRLGAVPAQAKGAAPVAPVPPAAGPKEKRAAGAFTRWRSLLAFLLGAVLLISLFFLAGLLLGPSGLAFPPSGCSPPPPAAAFPGCSQSPPKVTPSEAPADPATDPALVTLMTAEQEKERSLRRQLEDLRRQLAEKAGQCARTPAPSVAPEVPEKKPEAPAEEVPDIPPSLAELMPTTPDPPPPQAETPKPKTETPPKEAGKPKKQARGEDLRIPESAKKNNDMSFLEGCWDSDSGLVAMNTGEPITVQYCFDANGNGTRTVIKSKSNDRCTGPVRAKFDALGNLHIQADGASCRRGGGFVPQQVECAQGAGDRADCYGQEKGGKRNKWDARFRRK